MSETTPKTIAVIGCGLGGASFASSLLTLFADTDVVLTVFDQGRGPGGRSSTRDGLHDHGCQFIRGDVATLISDWVSEGKLQEWQPKTAAQQQRTKFFGFPTEDDSVFYPTTGGMTGLVHSLCKDIESSGKATIKTSTHVLGVERSQHDQYIVKSECGIRAIHDIPDSERPDASEPDVNGPFDYVIFTDPSTTTLGSWMRASASNPSETFVEKVKSRIPVRVPLFTVVVSVFDEDDNILKSIGDDKIEALTFDEAKTCWFAAFNGSKPGLSKSTTWIIISTPSFAVDEVERVPMQTPEGEFIPQDKNYLITGPCKIMAD